MSREVDGWAAKVGLLSLRVVAQQQCNGHCPCDSAQARQLKQRSALVAGQCGRGDTAIDTSIVLAAVHGLFRAVVRGRAAFTLSSPVPPPSPLSPTLISHLASVDVKQNGPKSTRLQLQICVPPWLPPSTVKKKEKKMVGGWRGSKLWLRPATTE